MMRASLGAGLSLLSLAACPQPEDPGPDKLFDDPSMAGMVEVVPCKQSHEHELHHVEIFADPASAELFQTCVLDQANCDPFPAGSLFVKREFEYPGCKPEDLVSYTSSLKLEAGSYPDGRDWHWQNQDADLTVTEDGAPFFCIACHVDHCSPPYGWDMRCIPD
ncbi:hypothetical protein ACNOYE_33935 [Nannocystaceae bacterium ST9]